MCISSINRAQICGDVRKRAFPDYYHLVLKVATEANNLPTATTSGSAAASDGKNGNKLFPRFMFNLSKTKHIDYNHLY